MKKAILILVLCIPMITGCGVLSKKKTEPLVPVKQVVQIDPKLLEPCPPGLQPLIGKLPEDVLDNTATNVKVYAACRDKQEASIEVIKKFANIKEVPK